MLDFFVTKAQTWTYENQTPPGHLPCEPPREQYQKPHEEFSLCAAAQAGSHLMGHTGAVWQRCPTHWEQPAHLIIVDELFLHHLHGINALGFLQPNQQHFGIAAPSNDPQQIKILQAQTGRSFATFPDAHCLWVKMQWNEEAALPVSATAKVSISNNISKLI